MTWEQVHVSQLQRRSWPLFAALTSTAVPPADVPSTAVPPASSCEALITGSTDWLDVELIM